MSEMPWRFDFELVGRNACEVQRFMDAVDAEAVSIAEWWFRRKESDEILEEYYGFGVVERFSSGEASPTSNRLRHTADALNLHLVYCQRHHCDPDCDDSPVEGQTHSRH